MALGEQGYSNSGSLSPFGLTPNGMLNGYKEFGRNVDGPFRNRAENENRPETIPCDLPSEEPGFDNVWCNFRCSGCHRLIGGSEMKLLGRVVASVE